MKNNKLILGIDKAHVQLFTTGFMQVGLVAINTLMISKSIVIGMIFSCAGINYLWTGNIKKVAFGTQKDRYIYTAGTVCGCVCGWFLVTHLIPSLVEFHNAHILYKYEYGKLNIYFI